MVGLRCVDVGCGAGAASCLLASLGADVISLDASPHCLDLARSVVRAHTLCPGRSLISDKISFVRDDWLNSSMQNEDVHLVFDKGTLDAIGMGDNAAPRVRYPLKGIMTQKNYILLVWVVE